MSYPSEWKAYCQWLRNGERSLPERVSQSELNRFSARYRLASTFEGIETGDYSDETKNAYGAVLKAFLAYSALEQLHKAVKPADNGQHLIERWGTMATEPASELRECETILVFLENRILEEMENNNNRGRTLLGRLQDFRLGNSDNCLSVATALRNAVAHGFMSVHPKGTSPRTADRFCSRIAMLLTEIADREFSSLVVELTCQE